MPPLVAIAGSLMISSTAPALLEGGSDRAAGIRGDVNPAADGYGGLLLGDWYRHDVFASAGAASSCRPRPIRWRDAGLRPIVGNRHDRAVGAPLCSSLADPREGICFGPHDVIEYYALPRECGSALGRP